MAFTMHSLLTNFLNGEHRIVEFIDAKEQKAFFGLTTYLMKNEKWLQDRCEFTSAEIQMIKEHDIRIDREDFIFCDFTSGGTIEIRFNPNLKLEQNDEHN